MKVKYIGSDNKNDLWLLKGNIYIVLCIEISADSKILFRLIGENDSSPALFDASLFETTDSKIPSSWIVHLKNGDLEFIPEKWARIDLWIDSFWEDYHNGLPKAIEVFEEDKNKIFSESEVISL